MMLLFKNCTREEKSPLRAVTLRRLVQFGYEICY